MVRVSGPLRVVTDRPLLVSQVRVRAARDRAEQGGLTAAFDDSVRVTDGQLDMVVLPGPAVMMLEVTGGFSHAVALVVPDVAEATLEQCVTAAQVAGDTDKRTLERLAGEVARDALAVSEAVGRAGDSATAAGAAEARAGEHADAAATSANAAKTDAGKAAASASAAAGAVWSANSSASAASKSASAAAQSATAAAGSAERAATIAGSTRWVGTQLEVNGQLSPDLKGEASKVPGPPGPPGVVVSTTQPSNGEVWIDPSETFDFASLEARLSAIEARLNEMPENTPINKWEAGEVYHGRWRVVYDGYGTVNGSLSRVYMNPAAPETLSQTHAALVVNEQVNEGDLDFVVTVKTLKQTRKNNPPNPWECAWVMWDWTAEDSFYAVALKPNGWELSKQDSTYDGNQRYIGSNITPTFDVGVPYRIWVKRVAGETYVRWAVEDPSQPDGIPATGWNYLWHFTDTERPLNKGNIAFYVEDAEVEFTGLVIR